MAVLRAITVGIALYTSPVLAASYPPCRMDCRQNAVNFAYMYGYPIREYERFTRGYTNATTNTLYHDRRLATSGSDRVVRPNVDTLYTAMFFDLSSEDLVLTIPPIEDRYWVCPFYDIYGNDLANIGAINDNQPGKYLIRYASEDFGFVLSEDDDDSGYLGHVNVPSAYGLMLGRILTNPDIEDQEAVNAIQDQFKVATVAREQKPVAPPLNMSIFDVLEDAATSDVSMVQAVLNLTAALAPYNPSPVISDRAWISHTLQNAGMENGIFTAPEGVKISEAPVAAGKSAAALRASPDGVQNLGNNWTASFPDYLGNYGSYYPARYITAIRGYLALTRDQTLYPALSLGTDFSYINLDASDALLFHFSRRPVLRPTGFWSFTIYDGAGLLIENELNVHSRGDRSKMVFPDGTLLDDKNHEDGEFQILVQPADVAPPVNWTNNWLPSPAGGGNVTVVLRFYGADPQMYDGAYVYPRMERIGVISE